MMIRISDHEEAASLYEESEGSAAIIESLDTSLLSNAGSTSSTISSSKTTSSESTLTKWKNILPTQHKDELEDFTT